MTANGVSSCGNVLKKLRPRIAGPSLQTSDLPPKVLSCVSFFGVQGVGGPSRPPTLSAPVQCCVQEWRQKGCEMQGRPSHPVRLTPYRFTNLAKTPLRLARSRVRRVASYTKGQCSQNNSFLSAADTPPSRARPRSPRDSRDHRWWAARGTRRHRQSS